MKIALLQMTSGADMAANIARFEALAAEAVANGAGFIATPENTFLMEGNRPHSNPPPQAGERIKRWTQEEHPGVKAAAEAARKHGVWLLIGSVAVLPDLSLRAERSNTDTVSNWIASSPEAPRNDGIKTYNRSVLFNPEGSVVAHYDKIHLFDVEVNDGQNYRESAKIVPGGKAKVAETPLGKIGMSVCYDVRFPHLYRALAKIGAEILAVPAAFTAVTGEAHWHTLLRARAIENGCFVIAPAQTGTHPGGRKTYGHSLVVDPWGTVLADGGTEEGVIFADIDLTQVQKVRSKIPSLQHDREFTVRD